MNYNKPCMKYRYGHVFTDGYRISLDDWYHWMKCKDGKDKAKEALKQLLLEADIDALVDQLIWYFEFDDK